MSQFLLFLKDNKEIVISALTLAVAVIGLIIKRKPKTLDDFSLIVSDVLSSVPVLVSKVEEAGHGQAKKNKVLDVCLSLTSKKLGRKLSDKERSIVIDKVSEQIEDVLTAPQKKLC